MSEPVLVDTHALIWWVSDPPRLSRDARSVLDAARSVLVSAPSGWEVALLVDAGRLSLDRPVEAWLSDVLRRHGTRPVPVDLELAVASVTLGRRGFHRDPADRFLYATAARERVPLVSKDRAIQSFARNGSDVRVIW